MRHFLFIVTSTFLCLGNTLLAQTIAEKKAGVSYGGDLSLEMQSFLVNINQNLVLWQNDLNDLYIQAQEMYQQDAPEEDYKILLTEINEIKSNMRVLEANWRNMASTIPGHEQEYALWHQPETTLGELVIDFGASDYVYLIPQEIASMKLSINSDLPIPRSSWGEMLELILLQSGVGTKQLNPYLKQLYLTEGDQSDVKVITDDRKDLLILPENSRICFVISPDPSDLRRTWFFLEKFANPSSTVMRMIGRDILVVGSVPEIQSLLKIYDFVSEHKAEQEYKIIALNRVDAQEMTDILMTIFETFEEEVIETAEGGEDKSRTPKARRNTEGSGGLKVVTLAEVAQAIFLVGTKEEIYKAESIIKEVESRMERARDRVIYTYKTKHSDPEELASILGKIYSLMISSGIGLESPAGPAPDGSITTQDVNINADTVVAPNRLPGTGTDVYRNQFFEQGGYLVNPAPVTPIGPIQRDFNVDRDNFIVDPKTGSIVMVVEADILNRLKDLIRKLDVPKKMVKVDVLLFEKVMRRQNNYGLNLLRLGERATNTHETSTVWNDGLIGQGVFQFFLSRECTNNFPAYDLIYRFLLSQDDIQINANPSVVTTNQTPATISIVEEISLNTGIFEVESTTGGAALKDAFTRAQYGITISVTPTIHVNDEKDSDYTEDTRDYVTLISEINFDTIQPGISADRPDVTRRQIQNEARVIDGQTIILGGLRRKAKVDSHEAIPYLGEIPGLGKLFSTTELQDNSTEMFIFLTPTIISDPCEDMEKIKYREMCMRPGDLPAFTQRLVMAQECEKNRLFQGYLTMLFGRPKERFIMSEPSACSRGGYEGK